MLPVGPMQRRISIFVLKQLDCYRTSNDLMKEARQPRRLEAINNIGARRTTLFALKNVSLFAWVLQIWFDQLDFHDGCTPRAACDGRRA